jgi:hypothetical protein
VPTSTVGGRWWKRERERQRDRGRERDREREKSQEFTDPGLPLGLAGLLLVSRHSRSRYLGQSCHDCHLPAEGVTRVHHYGTDLGSRFFIRKLVDLTSIDYYRSFCGIFAEVENESIGSHLYLLESH